MNNLKLMSLLFVGSALTLAATCSKSDDSITTTSSTTSTTSTNFTDLPDAFTKFRDGVEVYLDGQYVVIECEGIPDHGSPYFSDNRYETYSGSNNAFHLNPNRIVAQNYTFRIPLNPTEAAHHESTPLGAIGVSLNGVPFFNQYAAGNAPLTYEINSFDHYNGHPQQTGAYHYHIEPLYLTATEGRDALLGFLLDGFPVYGPMENGKKVTNADLDEYHGHFHATDEYPDGIYHYHITDEDPYLNGNGFFGTPGNVSH